MSATLTQKGPAEAGARQYYLTEEHHPENGTMLGFWIYLMSDLLIFACLFATYGAGTMPPACPGAISST